MRVYCIKLDVSFNLSVQITDMADAERKWTYLEATDKGYHLYIRHGFEVLYTSQVKPDAPKMLHMARPQQ